MTETGTTSKLGGDSSGRSAPAGEATPGGQVAPVLWRVDQLWPAPQPAPRWVVPTAAAAGLVAALMIPVAPLPGIDLLICALAVALPVAFLAYRHGRSTDRRWPVGRVTIGLGAISIALAAVGSVRASEWLAWGCALAALCIGAAAALDLRRLRDLLATVPLFAGASLRALPWAGRTVPVGRIREVPRHWLSGLGIGIACTVVVAALLASADQAFADLIDVLWPSVDLGLFPAQVVVFVAAAGISLGGMFAVTNRIALRRTAAAKARASHPAEWLTPLVLVTGTIAAFLAVEATTLFGGAEVVGSGGSVTHADRAREGFGQLIVVTLIVLALLAWTGRAAADGPPAHRRLLGAAGGALLVLTLLLVTSALRRLWLYQDAYGWTVARLIAGSFELWVAALLLGVALAWLVRRTDLLPRFLIGSAGLGLLAVGMAGPDAIVAEANVTRFEQTEKIDVFYLSLLSADAVPALDRLPEPQRSCALGGHLGDGHVVSNDPWFGWNLGRARADEILRARPPGPCTLSQWLG